MFFVLGPAPATSVDIASVQGELYRANAIGNYDTAAMRCRTRDNVEILFYATHAVNEFQNPVSIFEFEKGVVRIGGKTAHDSALTAEINDGSVREYGAINVDHAGKIQCMIESILSDRSPVCGIEAAMIQTLCMNGPQDSAAGIVEFPKDMVSRTAWNGEDLMCSHGRQ